MVLLLVTVQLIMTYNLDLEHKDIMFYPNSQI